MDVSQRLILGLLLTANIVQSCKFKVINKRYDRLIIKLSQIIITGTMVDVVLNLKVPLDANSKEMTIRTDSVAGSGEAIRMWFYDDNKGKVGIVWIHFMSTIKYKIESCTNNTPFPVSPPTDTDKTWRIGYNLAEKRVLIHCNEVEVLNLVLSDSVCTQNGNWRTWWGRNPTQIKIPFSDNASDQYCLAGM